MNQSFETLSLLAEINVAFVAFAAIVASIRVTLGKKLSPFQALLVRFFIETGMLTTSITLLPLVLWEFFPDETRVATYSLFYLLVSGGGYFLYYVRKRLAIKAPTPVSSLLVMIGWGIWFCIVILTLTGIFWQPTMAIIIAGCLWALGASVIIFSTFLSSFIDMEDK